ncbi:conserved hypothetical protein [Agrobacterium deltaense RV3]|nr:conserved hypothetical protein [Agrobacterium deltaense RV3]
MAAILTGDTGLTQDYAISSEIEDSIPPIADLLQSIDSSFRAVPHVSGSSCFNAFRNSSGYRVEFLTTNRGSEEYADQPAQMPALAGASAEPLRYMDFLIRDPVETILLHSAGVSVVVPDPFKFAVHKLILAGRRQDDAGGRAKKEKDLRQAGMLFEALQETGAGRDLADALREAWDRDPSWRKAITAGVDAVQRQYQPAVHRTFGILPADEREKARMI